MHPSPYPAALPPVADSPAWRFFVKLTFAIASAALIFGVCVAPINMWIRGYLLMGVLFLVGSSFMLAKALRDEFETQRAQQRAGMP